MLRLIRKKLQTPIPYLKDGVEQVKLPRDNLYRALHMDFEVVLDPKAQGPAAGTLRHNDYLNIIKQIKLNYDGTEVKFALSGVDKFHLDSIELETAPLKDTIGTFAANVKQTLHFHAVFDFAQDRKRYSDFSALFDAPSKSSVVVSVEWGSISDVYATTNQCVVDPSTKVNLTLVEAFDDGREGGTSLASIRDSLVDIRYGVEQIEIDKAHTSYDDDTKEVVVTPTPVVMLSHTIFAKRNITDNNPQFQDDVIDQVKLLNTEGGGEFILQDSWKTLVASNKTEFSQEGRPVGIWYADWTDLRQGGLRNLDVEALKYRFLTHAPAGNTKNAIRILKKFIPVTTG